MPLPSAELVYATTKDGILSGEIAGGTLLSEAEVAGSLSVSRTPAREAFVRLEAEGLLRLLPRRGALVTPLAPTEAQDVLDVRVALEVAAVRRLVVRDDRQSLLAAARAEVDEQAGLVEASDVGAFAASDERFHRALVDAAGNAIASGFYATLGDRQRRMSAAAVGAYPDRLGSLLAAHRRLLARVRSGDAEGFATALRAHLEQTHRVVLAR